MYRCLGTCGEFVPGVALKEHLGWGSNSLGETMAAAVGWLQDDGDGDLQP